MKKEKRQILEAIELGFGAAKYPGDSRLAGRVVTDVECKDEYAYVVRYFRGRHWRDITLEGLSAEYPGPHDVCLFFMSPEAFRFFLPAYMKIAVMWQGSGDTAADSAVHALLPKPEDSWWTARAKGFTKSQVGAIVAFLGYMQSAHAHAYRGLTKAIRYWSARA